MTQNLLVVAATMALTVNPIASTAAQTAAQATPTARLPYGDAAALQQWADKGDAEAQFLVGFRLENDRKPDLPAAARWYRRSADQGFAMAQFSLALLYADGRGVSRNAVTAVSWFRRAADQGLPRAQANLGVAYASGTGVPQDYEQATHWWLKAAEQGDEVAQFRLGLAYFAGVGVLEDPIEAHRWLNIAASRAPEGERTAYANQRDTVAGTLTKEQLSEAQRRATSWLETFSKRKQ